jgi:hypothetical protein
MNNFPNNFPKIKQVSAQILGNNLLSVQPMTVEEIAKGRPIRPYPLKYDDFESYETMKEWIINKLQDNTNLKAEWLDVSRVEHLPLDLRNDVYYSDVKSINISCYDPEEIGCLRQGETLSTTCNKRNKKIQ